MADANDLIEDSPKHLSRRNVVVGTAWAVPVVMGVGLSPEVAASTGPLSNVSLTGTRNRNSDPVHFVWLFKTAATLTSVAVTIPSVTGGTMGSASTVTGTGTTTNPYRCTFSFTPSVNKDKTVPTFTMTVVYKPPVAGLSATFTVSASSVGQNGSVTFGVS